MLLALPFFGLIAGYIDSIAGGGGLITLPVLMWALQAGPDAIGTNKIPGTVAAFVALLVYRRAGHFILGQSLWFSLAVGMGSICGTFLTPYLPPFLFPLFLLILSPLILWILSAKDLWIQNNERPASSRERVLLWGALAGLYDGMWGPGGGTFMFLGLFLGARLPLLQAIASSKLANTLSALFSLTSFSLRGYVHWRDGVLIASGIALGAYMGAQQTHKTSAKTVRPVLAVVTFLLVLKVVFDQLS